MINTITLCGSTRFMDDFREANIQLTRGGLSVISLSFATQKELDGVEIEKGMKEVLDLVHFNKILRSDAIVVVGDGYIGFSTAREILWASMQGKGLHRTMDHMESGGMNWPGLAYCIVDGRSQNGSNSLIDQAQEVLRHL